VIWAFGASAFLKWGRSMSNRYTRGIIAAIGCILTFTVSVSLAKGPAGHPGQPSHSHSDNARAQTGLPAYANSWPFLRAENGIFGPTWAAPGPGSGGIGYGSGAGFGSLGYGGIGYGGLGYGGYGGIIPGWGYGYGLTDLYPGGVPYFSLFPPVYYDYADGAIAPKSSSATPWTANMPVQPGGDVPPAPLPGPHPLRIANPYYSAGK
jgi:hypothetical protein